MTSKQQSAVRALVSQGKIEKAIKYLIDCQDLSSDTVDKIVRLSGEYYEMEEDFLQGVLSKENRRVVLNRLRIDLLRLVSSNYDRVIEEVNEKDLSFIPTINEDRIVGREDEITEIKKGFERSNVILLHGIRGVGKSVIAKLFVNRFRDDHNFAIWVDVIEGVKESIMADKVLLENIGIEGGMIPQHKKVELRKSNRKQFDFVLSRIGKFKQDRLKSRKNILILDNVKDISELKTILGKFPKSHWNILITSHYFSGAFEDNNIRIDSLSTEEAKLQFRNRCKREIIDEESLQLLVNSVGNHPLTVDLLSRAYSKSFDLELHDLLVLRKANNVGVDYLALEVDTDHNNYERPVEIHTYVQQLFEFEELTLNEEIILQLFALLPQVRIEGSRVLATLSGLAKRYITFAKVVKFLTGGSIDVLSRGGIINSLHSLNKKGWLEYDDEGYKCHEVVREVVLQKIRPYRKNFYEPIIKSLYAQYHTSGDFMVGFLISVTLINLSSNEPKNKRLSEYYKIGIVNLGNVGLSRVALHFIDAGEKFFEGVNTIDRTEWNLEKMKIYVLEGDNKNYKKVQELVENTLSNLSLSKQTSHLFIKYKSFMGLRCSVQSKFKQSLHWYMKSCEISERYQSNQVLHIRALFNVGVSYYKMKNYKKAKSFLTDSLRISKKLYGHNNHPYDVHCLELLSKC